MAVAFSGGVDSGVLLHAAHAVLAKGAMGMTADSPSLPRRELAEARELAARIGVRHEVFATDELADAGYRANRGDRCYHCKRVLFGTMAERARAAGMAALAFGEVIDDLLDDRPGVRAAREAGAVAPLQEAGLDKTDVRRYAREHRLPIADKPSAACLASRIPVGTEVSSARLARVEAAEERVRARGFRVLRVRHHGEVARLEVGAEERARADELRTELTVALAAEGFATVEFATYRTPGM